MRIYIKHTTRYRYDHSPIWVIHKAVLTPQDDIFQKVIRWGISVNGGGVLLVTKDQFGNHVTLIKSKNKLISIIAEGEIETGIKRGQNLRPEKKLPVYCYLIPTFLTKPGKNLNRIISKFSKGQGKPEGFLNDVSELTRAKVHYQKNTTSSGTSAEEAFSIGSGVCQDHTHIMISIARALGLPARYVSGYLKLRNKKMQEASHAWVEVFFDGYGWRAFDISNGIAPDQNYVSLARGFDYTDVAPIKGVKIGASGESMSTDIIVDENQ